MAIMFGNGTVKTYNGENAFIMRTEQFTTDATAATTLPTEAASVTAGTTVSGWNQIYTAPDGKRYVKKNPKFYDATGNVLVGSSEEPEAGEVKWPASTKIFCSYDLLVDGSVIEISANSFPGTYYVVGDTYARNEASGEDEFFQFIVPKAKVQSENTITLEAEGDPSVFNMNLRVMRPADGQMMKLVKYNLEGGEAAAAEGNQATLIHNHTLNVNNMSELAEG